LSWRLEVTTIPSVSRAHHLSPNFVCNSTANFLSTTPTLFDHSVELVFEKDGIGRGFWIHGRPAIADTREIEREKP
jgi:hypothetical protein